MGKEADRAWDHLGLIRKLWNYIREHRARMLRFLTTGGISAVVNLGALALLVEVVGLSTPVLQNVANVLAMELSIIVQYVLSSVWTFADRERTTGWRLLGRVGLFHSVVGASILLRTLLFPLLQAFGIPYLLNAAIGIALGAVLNFAGYNHLVFRRSKHAE